MIKILVLINIAALIYGGITDHKRREIPNLVPIILLLTGIFPGQQIMIRILSLLLTVAVLFLASKVSKTRLPGGDFKLICALAFSGGLLCVIAVLFLTGIGAIIVSFVKKGSFRRNIPLCTYVAPAYILLCVAQLI